jgi:SnoaL-like domain
MAIALSTEDRLDIAELVARLCQSLDFSDPDAYVAQFANGGIFEARSDMTPAAQIRFRHQGADQLRAFAEAAVTKRAGLARHWTGNLVIRGGGQGASGTSYVMLVVIDPDTGARSIAMSGVHHDEYVRTPAGWRFARRSVVGDV